MTFSIIMAVWNAEETIAQAIQSVVTQTYMDWELLISDGGSTDDTLREVERFSSSVSWMRTGPDAGIADAWNRALTHASGDWVLFLGADDQLASPTALADAALFLGFDSDGFALACGRVQVVQANGDVLFESAETASVAWERLPRGMGLPHQGVFHRRDVLQSVGPFDIGLRVVSDYELLCRIWRTGARIIALDSLIVTKMRCGGLSSDLRSRSEMVREFGVTTRRHFGRRASLRWLPSLMWSYVLRASAAVIGVSVTLRLSDFVRRCMGRPSVHAFECWRAATRFGGP